MAGAAAASLMTPVNVAASAETGAAAAAAGAVALVLVTTVDVCGALSSSSASFEGSLPLPQATMSVTANSMDRNFFISFYLLIGVTPSVSEGPGGAGGAPPFPPGPSLTLGVTGGNDGRVGSTAGCASLPADLI